MTFMFRLLDPRPSALEVESAWLAEHPALGIEVTVPALAEACRHGNIDPQHAGCDAGTSAIEAIANGRDVLVDQVMSAVARPPVALVTVRPDSDALGGMALLQLLADGGSYEDLPPGVLDRARLIGAADRGPAPELVVCAPAPSAICAPAISALRWMAQDHAIPLEGRVGRHLDYLVTGEFADMRLYAGRVRAAQAEAITVVDAADTFEAHPGGRVSRSENWAAAIALVTTTSRYASALYRRAPVVVAVHPEFVFSGGQPHRKIVIMQEAPGYVDLQAVWPALNNIEQGLAAAEGRRPIGSWGGSPTIGGSPQGESTHLHVDDVLATVARHWVAGSLAADQRRA